MSLWCHSFTNFIRFYCSLNASCRIPFIMSMYTGIYFIFNRSWFVWRNFVVDLVVGCWKILSVSWFQTFFARVLRCIEWNNAKVYVPLVTQLKYLVCDHWFAYFYHVLPTFKRFFPQFRFSPRVQFRDLLWGSLGEKRHVYPMTSWNINRAFKYSKDASTTFKKSTSIF